MPAPEPKSPLWWLLRLEKELSERGKAVELLDNYYEGDHPLPLVPDRARDPFRRMLKQARANWTGLIVEAVAERLHVDGFRLDAESGTGDADAWNLWEANELGAESELVHTEALVQGEAYVTVWANPADPQVPLISPERTAEMAVERDPQNRRVLAAAVKVFRDPWTTDVFGTVYLPDGIWKYRRPKDSSGQWVEREAMLANPLGVVPVVAFLNRPRLRCGGRSEIEDVLDIQDRINKQIFDRLMASEFSSFRQRWATGMDIPLDDKGNPKEPFQAAVDRLWISEDPATNFGEFTATDLGPYIAAVESDIQHMAAISRTPPHYLLGKMLNISGDALKAAESGLASKAKSRARHFGEAWEKVIRLAFAVLDDARSKVTDSQTIWADPETRTEGERVDALVKMATLGVPREALWERWGASQQEIERWRGMQVAEALTSQAVDLTALTNQPAGGAAAPPGAGSAAP